MTHMKCLEGQSLSSFSWCNTSQHLRSLSLDWMSGPTDWGHVQGNSQECCRLVEIKFQITWNKNQVVWYLSLNSYIYIYYINTNVYIVQIYIYIYAINYIYIWITVYLDGKWLCPSQTFHLLLSMPWIALQVPAPGSSGVPQRHQRLQLGLQQARWKRSVWLVSSMWFQKMKSLAHCTATMHGLVLPKVITRVVASANKVSE